MILDDFGLIFLPAKIKGLLGLSGVFLSPTCKTFLNRSFLLVLPSSLVETLNLCCHLHGYYSGRAELLVPKKTVDFTLCFINLRMKIDSTIYCLLAQYLFIYLPPCCCCCLL